MRKSISQSFTRVVEQEIKTFSKILEFTMNKQKRDYIETSLRAINSWVEEARSNWFGVFNVTHVATNINDYNTIFLVMLNGCVYELKYRFDSKYILDSCSLIYSSLSDNEG